MIRPGNDLRLRRVSQERLEVIVQAVPVGPLFRGEHRFAVLLGSEKCRQLRGLRGWLLLCRTDGGRPAQQLRQDQRKRFQTKPPGFGFGAAPRNPRMPTAAAASAAAMAPAAK